MTPRALHWLAQDGVKPRGLGLVWLTLGACAFCAGFAAFVALSGARDGLIRLVGPGAK